MNLSGVLNGGGAAFFGSLMASYFLAGKVYRSALTYDQYGDLSQVDTEYDCLLQVDVMTEAMRAEQGAADSDRAIFILSTSTTAPVDSDCEIVALAGPYAGIRYQIASVTRDPVGSYHSCRGRRAA